MIGILPNLNTLILQESESMYLVFEHGNGLKHLKLVPGLIPKSVRKLKLLGYEFDQSLVDESDNSILPQELEELTLNWHYPMSNSFVYHGLLAEQIGKSKLPYGLKKLKFDIKEKFIKNNVWIQRRYPFIKSPSYINRLQEINFGTQERQVFDSIDKVSKESNDNKNQSTTLVYHWTDNKMIWEWKNLPTEPFIADTEHIQRTENSMIVDIDDEFSTKLMINN